MADQAGRPEAHLYVLAGSDVARSFVLGERTLVGRSEECEIVLHDRSISRKHAVFVRRDDGWFVQDLGSTNGIRKGGQRAERFDLSDGDELQLGDLPVRFKLQVPAEEGLDLDFAAPAAPPPPPPPVQAPAPAARAAAPRVEDPEDEIEIEEDIEIEVPQAGAPLASGMAATSFSPPRAERRTGVLAGDLEQRPFWLRVLLFLVVLGVAGGLGYGVFRAVQMLREGL